MKKSGLTKNKYFLDKLSISKKRLTKIGYLLKIYIKMIV